MSTKTKTTDARREQLKAVYLYVVENWAVAADEVAAGVEREVKEVRADLNRLSRRGLVVGDKINGEKTLTWQSYFDIDNELDVPARAAAEFDKEFPEGSVKTGASHEGATGARYTEEQLAAGKASREQGSNWERVAADAGVKAASHFSKAVRAAYPEVK